MCVYDVPVWRLPIALFIGTYVTQRNLFRLLALSNLCGVFVLPCTGYERTKTHLDIVQEGQSNNSNRAQAEADTAE